MNMTQGLTIFCTALVAAGCATAPQQNIEAKITEYGVYQRGAETVRAEPSAVSGHSRKSNGYQLRQTTRDIPLEMGASFGFCYEIAGIPAFSNAQIVIAITHPPFAQPGKPASAQEQRKIRLTPFNGVVSDCTGYGFDHDYELVPGPWRFVILMDDKALLEQEFVVK